MRTLTNTLTAAQKNPRNILWKIVLTQSANSYTYTKTRVRTIDHREEPFSQKAEVVLNNSDKTLTSLDFKGYKGVISYGLNTSAGDEYSACALLYVISQSLQFSPGKLSLILNLKGIPDLLDDDKASSIYIPSLTDTPKTLINAILGATLVCYSHCTAYTVNWDSESSLVDTFLPKQVVIIYEGTSRLEAIQRYLSYIPDMMLWKADGQAHMFVPKISGQTWVVATVYIVHDYVQPSTPNNNFTYECTTAGTSHGSTEPTWPVVGGNAVNDNGVIWTARAHDYFYNLI